MTIFQFSYFLYCFEYPKGDHDMKGGFAFEATAVSLGGGMYGCIGNIWTAPSRAQYWGGLPTTGQVTHFKKATMQVQANSNSPFSICVIAVRVPTTVTVTASEFATQGIQYEDILDAAIAGAWEYTILGKSKSKYIASAIHEARVFCNLKKIYNSAKTISDPSTNLSNIHIVYIMESVAAAAGRHVDLFEDVEFSIVSPPNSQKFLLMP